MLKNPFLAYDLPIGQPESHGTYAFSSSCRGLIRVLNGAPVIPIGENCWDPYGLAGVKMNSHSERSHVGADGSMSKQGDGPSTEQNSTDFVHSKSSWSASTSLGILNGYVVT